MAASPTEASRAEPLSADHADDEAATFEDRSSQRVAELILERESDKKTIARLQARVELLQSQLTTSNSLVTHLNKQVLVFEDYVADQQEQQQSGVNTQRNASLIPDPTEIGSPMMPDPVADTAEPSLMETSTGVRGNATGRPPLPRSLESSTGLMSLTSNQSESGRRGSLGATTGSGLPLIVSRRTQEKLPVPIGQAGVDFKVPRPQRPGSAAVTRSDIVHTTNDTLIHANAELQKALGTVEEAAAVAEAHLATDLAEMTTRCVKLQDELGAYKRENAKLKARLADDILRDRQEIVIRHTAAKLKGQRKTRVAGLARLEALETTLMSLHDDVYYCRRDDAIRAPMRDVLLVMMDFVPERALAEEAGELFPYAIKLYHEAVRNVATRHSGYVAVSSGSRVLCAFSEVRGAVSFAAEIQVALKGLAWPDTITHHKDCRKIRATEEQPNLDGLDEFQRFLKQNQHERQQEEAAAAAAADGDGPPTSVTKRLSIATAKPDDDHEDEPPSHRNHRGSTSKKPPRPVVFNGPRVRTVVISGAPTIDIDPRTGAVRYGGGLVVEGAELLHSLRPGETIVTGSVKDAHDKHIASMFPSSVTTSAVTAATGTAAAIREAQMARDGYALEAEWGDLLLPNVPPTNSMSRNERSMSIQSQSSAAMTTRSAATLPTIAERYKVVIRGLEGRLHTTVPVSDEAELEIAARIENAAAWLELAHSQVQSMPPPQFWSKMQQHHHTTAGMGLAASGFSLPPAIAGHPSSVRDVSFANDIGTPLVHTHQAAGRSFFAAAAASMPAVQNNTPGSAASAAESAVVDITSASIAATDFNSSVAANSTVNTATDDRARDRLVTTLYSLGKLKERASQALETQMMTQHDYYLGKIIKPPRGAELAVAIVHVPELASSAASALVSTSPQDTTPEVGAGDVDASHMVEAAASVGPLADASRTETIARLAELLDRLATDVGGYLVKRDRDVTLVVFPAIVDALGFACSVHQAAMAATWPEELDTHPVGMEIREESDPKKRVVFRGPRIRIGLDVGRVSHEMDPVTGHADYSGTPLTRAAFLSAIARPGETLTSGAFMRQVRGAKLHQTPNVYTISKIGGREGPGGIPVEVHSILPAKLGIRVRFWTRAGTKAAETVSGELHRIQHLLLETHHAAPTIITPHQAKVLRAVDNLLKRDKRLKRAASRNETLQMMSHDDSGMLGAVPPPTADLNTGTDVSVAIMFTDVENTNRLTDAAGDAFKRAQRHFNRIVLDACHAHDGYPFAHNGGDAFGLAFPCTRAAVEAAHYIQETLLGTEWPVELAKHESSMRVKDVKTGVVLFNGLRARCGIASGIAPARYDPITCRTVFSGPTVGLAAKLGRYPCGGDVWLALPALDQLRQEPGGSALLDVCKLTNVSDAAKVSAVSLLPSQLSGRIGRLATTSRSERLNRMEDPRGTWWRGSGGTPDVNAVRIGNKGLPRVPNGTDALRTLATDSTLRACMPSLLRQRFEELYAGSELDVTIAASSPGGTAAASPVGLGSTTSPPPISLTGTITLDSENASRRSSSADPPPDPAAQTVIGRRRAGSSSVSIGRNSFLVGSGDMTSPHQGSPSHCQASTMLVPNPALIKWRNKISMLLSYLIVYSDLLSGTARGPRVVRRLEELFGQLTGEEDDKLTVPPAGRMGRGNRTRSVSGLEAAGPSRATRSQSFGGGALSSSASATYGARRSSVSPPTASATKRRQTVAVTPSTARRASTKGPHPPAKRSSSVSRPAPRTTRSPSSSTAGTTTASPRTGRSPSTSAAGPSS